MKLSALQVTTASTAPWRAAPATATTRVIVIWISKAGSGSVSARMAGSERVVTSTWNRTARTEKTMTEVLFAMSAAANRATHGHNLKFDF